MVKEWLRFEVIKQDRWDSRKHWSKTSYSDTIDHIERNREVSDLIELPKTCIECGGKLRRDPHKFQPLLSYNGLYFVQQTASVHEWYCTDCGLVHNFDIYEYLKFAEGNNTEFDRRVNLDYPKPKKRRFRIFLKHQAWLRGELLKQLKEEPKSISELKNSLKTTQHMIKLLIHPLLLQGVVNTINGANDNIIYYKEGDLEKAKEKLQAEHSTEEDNILNESGDSKWRELLAKYPKIYE